MNFRTVHSTVQYSAVQYSTVQYLVQSAAPQIVGNDHVRHGIEDKLNVLGVGGAGHVTVDLLGGGLVLSLELSLDVGSSLTVLLGT